MKAVGGRWCWKEQVAVGPTLIALNGLVAACCCLDDHHARLGTV